MKLALMSDLHLEFADYKADFPEADMLLLAGDMASQNPKSILRHAAFMTRANEFYNDNVVEIDGNHTGYGGHIDDIGNISYSIHLEGYSIIACTLWSGADSQFAYTQLNDKHIGGFTWDWMYEKHKKDVAFLDREIAFAKKMLGHKVVVMTHHMPHVNCVADKWGAKNYLTPADAIYDINRGFYTDLDWLIKKHNPEVWCSGHTHDSYDFIEGETRMICNPRGYPTRGGGFENRDFNPMLTFEV